MTYKLYIYDSGQDAVIMTDMDGRQLVIECKRANAQVIFDDPSDELYLKRLARENPAGYVAFALKPNGLQGYVEAMNVFN